MDELCLITPEYLVPYLSYVKENQRLFRTGIENAAALRLEDSYKGLPAMSSRRYSTATAYRSVRNRTLWRSICTA